MWSETILHVDMDSFFVEVERLSREDLRNRPVAVGGTGGRGVIASASYEARRFGVKSAQPTAVARRLCPELVVVSPSHRTYGDVSAKVFEVFHSFTPRVEGLSLDEAFLDIVGLRHHYGSPVEVGHAIQAKVRSVAGLPCSVGIASTKFVAKLASKAAKPEGLRLIESERQDEFLLALPVEELWGVGPATLAGLKKLGIATVGDLAALPESTLSSVLGRSQGAHLYALARGVDPRRVEPQSTTKQVSVEETYGQDLEGRALVESALMAHSQRLAMRLRSAALRPRTISLKVRYDDFTTVSRSRTATSGVDSSRDIFRLAKEMLSDVPADRPVRLLGLAGSSFEETNDGRQLLLEEEDPWSRVSRVVGEMEDRFGSAVVEPARLLDWQETSE
ncbi:MAG: DNA polymerase IV [Acidimicrobiia bacterium]